MASLEAATLPKEGNKKARTTGYTCDTGLGVKMPGLMMTGSAPLVCPLDTSRELSNINIACLGVKIKQFCFLSGQAAGSTRSA